jgi:uncharacterized YccA/Bax inhibitor family protein
VRVFCGLSWHVDAVWDRYVILSNMKGFILLSIVNMCLVVAVNVLLRHEQLDVVAVAGLVLQVCDESLVEKHESALVRRVFAHQEVLFVGAQTESASLWIRLELEIGVQESGGEL